MKSINKVTIGADPEVFLKDVNTGEIVSAEGIIGGDKENPKAITKKGHFVQEDNVMAEFCIPPCETENGFLHNIGFMLNYLNVNTPDNLKIAIQASAILDKKYLETKQALTFGCDPDFNAYSLSINSAPDSLSNMRTAGGHIHVGYETPNEDISVELIKAMDLYLGVPSIIMDPDSDRRSMYGKAGAFRIKSYGVEYRTLSNFWLKDEEHIRWAYKNTLLAIERVNKGEIIDSALASEITDAIDYNDVEGASELIGYMNIPFIEPKTAKPKKVRKSGEKVEAEIA